MNDMIEEFGEVVTVTRGSPQGAPTSDGSVSTGPTTTFQCSASIQPIGGYDLVAIPEGERQKGWFWAYSETQMNTSSTYPNIPADIITRSDGSQYRVAEVRPWQSGAISIAPYWQAKICAVNP